MKNLAALLCYVMYISTSAGFGRRRKLFCVPAFEFLVFWIQPYDYSYSLSGRKKLVIAFWID
jgi:hypothetical protein